jgi:SAM-dependent methyltransferase
MTARFDEQASEYHECAIIQRDLAKWVAEWLEPQAFGLEGIEFGAGTGFLTERIIRTGISLRATDLALHMVEVGSAKAPQAHWEMADAWNPSTEWQADRVFSTGLLQWCPSPWKALARWRACLRRGGRLLSGLFVSETLPELENVLPDASPLVWRSAEEWRALLENVGFGVIRAEASERTYCFENACAVLRYMHRIGSVHPGRFSVGALREALRNYDMVYAKEEGVLSTWTFFRIECLCVEDD